MMNYRLYLLDADKDVLRALEFASLNDQQAIAVADQHPAAREATRELWQGGRLVQSWSSDR
jgi:hypothetical protein